MLIYNNRGSSNQFMSYIMRIKEKNYNYMCSYIYINNYPFIKEKRIINIYAHVDIYL